MINNKRNEVEFKDGRKLKVYAGIIGLTDDWELVEGYDTPIDEDLSKEEKEEIADYMIERWRRYREYEI